MRAHTPRLVLDCLSEPLREECPASSSREQIVDPLSSLFPRKLAAKRSGNDGAVSYRLEGRAFVKLFSATPRLLSSSFRATDIDLVFARVRFAII